MSSQLKFRFSHTNISATEYIRVKEKKIPIFNVEKEINKNNKIYFVEKFLRCYYEELKTINLTFFANYLYHEIIECSQYEDFENEIRNILILCNNVSIRQISKDSCIESVEDMEQKSAILEICNEDEEMIYMLFNAEHLCDSELSKNYIFRCYEKNREAVCKFGLKEMEYYQAAKHLLASNENVEDIKKIVAVLMLCFPMYIYRIEREVVKKELWKETVISRIYHENSKLRTFHQQGDFMKPLDEIDDEVKELTAQGRKNYSQNVRIKLPKADKSSKYSIEDTIMNRRSRRHYSNISVSIQTLSNILYYSYGVTGKLDKTKLMLRAVPSGGGLYPIDIYIAINNVEGVERGIYYYDPLTHEIVLVNRNDLTHISKDISGYAAMLDTAAFTFILGANFWRNQWKYHERGYRVILIDCGHIAQNLHMMSTAYDLGSCCLMGFVDDELNKLLELDGIVEHSMYMITVGVNRGE